MPEGAIPSKVNRARGIRLAVQISLVALACVAATIVKADTINISEGLFGENGVLVDGYHGEVLQEPKAQFIGPAGRDISVSVGDFTAPPGEIIGFTVHRAPTIKQANDPNDPRPFTWTSGSDTVNFTYESEVPIHVYYWFITGPVADRHRQAVDGQLTTNAIWHEERQGIYIKGFNSVDVTQDGAVQMERDPSRPDDFNCGTATPIKSVLSGRPDFKANAINVFYVANVKGERATDPFGPDYGQHCPGHVILMGSDTRPHLLAHELGHALSLGEANDSPSLCPATLPLSCTLNVMHPATWSRQYLTEGQTFRAMVNEGSAINKTDFYNLRPGLVKRPCTDGVVSTSCPDIATRIWLEP